MRKIIVTVASVLLASMGMNSMALPTPTPSQPPATPPSPPAPFSLTLGDTIRLLPSLQFRPRMMAHTGRDFAPGNNYVAYTHRARIGLEVRAYEWIAISMQVQDVRMWGEEQHTVTDYAADGIDFHQAWVQLGYAKGLSLKVGRQEMILDNHRLIGSVDWADSGRAFDGAALSYVRGTAQARLFWSKVKEDDVLLPVVATATPAKLRPNVDLAGAWFRSERFTWLRPSAVVLYDRDDIASQNRFTFGAYLDGQPATGLTYSAEFYYQAGFQGDAPQKKTIGAWMTGLRAMYVAPVKLKPALAVWFDYLSGDDNAKDNDIHTFDTLYGTNHKFYGLMDLFDSAAQTKSHGLMDVAVRLQLSPTAWLSTYVDYHNLRAAKAFVDASGNTLFGLGNELDWIAEFKVNRFLAFDLGAGVFFANKGAACTRTTCAGSAQNELFGYAMINATL